MCAEREGEIRSRSRKRLGRRTRREGGRGPLLPNEGSALVELKMDMEEGVFMYHGANAAHLRGAEVNTILK